MERQELKKEITEILATHSGKPYDIIYKFYCKMENLDYDNQIVYFELLCELFGYIKSDRTIKVEKVFDQDEINNYKENIGDYVNELLLTSLKKANKDNLEPYEFYGQLWSNLINNKMFETKKEYVFALYYILIDIRVPYCLVGTGVQMENGEYEEIIKRNEDVARTIRYIVNFNFEEKTEEASLILNELDNIKDDKEKCVLLSIAFSRIRSQKDKIIEKLLDMCSESKKL